MTAKERRARAQKNLAIVAYLISPIDTPTLTKEVKLDTHYIDTIINIAHQMNLDGGVKMTKRQVTTAICNYYLTRIKESNLYITGFRFTEGVDDTGRNIVEVFATIRVDLKPKQSDSLILGTKVPLRDGSDREKLGGESDSYRFRAR
jgi:hypothetical protein